MKNKLILSLCLMMFCLSFAVAVDCLPHKQNTDLSFSITSNNATACNVTGYNYQLGYVEMLEQMTKVSQTFNVSFEKSNFTELGIYTFNLVCTDGTTIETGSICREVTPMGNITNSWKIALEIFVSLSTLFLMILFLYLAGYGINNRDIDADNYKAMRFLFIGLALVFLVAHILITNVVVHDTLGVGSISAAYTNVMYIFFMVLIFMFMFTMFKVGSNAVSSFQKARGLK